MADTQYYGVPIPTVNGDFSTWGDKNNTLHETWDAKLASVGISLKGKNTSGTGPHLDLSPAQVVAMLPVFTITSRGLAPQAASADANRPLTGDGTYKRGISRVAWAYITLNDGSVSMDQNVGIASATWSPASGGSVQLVTIVMSPVMPNTRYAVHLAFENNPAGVNTTSGFGINSGKSVSTFQFAYNSSLQGAVVVSVFEAP